VVREARLPILFIPLHPNRMANLEYGTADFYAEGFSDYLADLEADDPQTTENLIEGFYRALDSWFEYHDAQARAYADIRKRVRQTLTV
jgi:hypothetical protein